MVSTLNDQIIDQEVSKRRLGFLDEEITFVGFSNVHSHTAHTANHLAYLEAYVYMLEKIHVLIIFQHQRENEKSWFSFILKTLFSL